MAIAMRAEAEGLGAVCLALAACVLQAGLQHPMLGRARRGFGWCWASAPWPEAEAHTMAIAVRAEAEGLEADCLSPAACGQRPGLQHPSWGLARPAPCDGLPSCLDPEAEAHTMAIAVRVEAEGRGSGRGLSGLLGGAWHATGRLLRLLGPGLAALLREAEAHTMAIAVRAEAEGSRAAGRVPGTAGYE